MVGQFRYRSNSLIALGFFFLLLFFQSTTTAEPTQPPAPSTTPTPEPSTPSPPPQHNLTYVDLILEYTLFRHFDTPSQERWPFLVELCSFATNFGDDAGEATTSLCSTLQGTASDTVLQVGCLSRSIAEATSSGEPAGAAVVLPYDYSRYLLTLAVRGGNHRRVDHFVAVLNNGSHRRSLGVIAAHALRDDTSPVTVSTAEWMRTAGTGDFSQIDLTVGWHVILVFGTVLFVGLVVFLYKRVYGSRKQAGVRTSEEVNKRVAEALRRHREVAEIAADDGTHTTKRGEGKEKGKRGGAAVDRSAGGDDYDDDAGTYDERNWEEVDLDGHRRSLYVAASQTVQAERAPALSSATAAEINDTARAERTLSLLKNALEVEPSFSLPPTKHDNEEVARARETKQLQRQRQEELEELERSRSARMARMLELPNASNCAADMFLPPAASGGRQGSEWDAANRRRRAHIPMGLAAKRVAAMMSVVPSSRGPATPPTSVGSLSDAQVSLLAPSSPSSSDQTGANLQLLRGARLSKLAAAVAQKQEQEREMSARETKDEEDIL